MFQHLPLALVIFLCTSVNAQTYTINASEALSYQLGKEKVIYAMKAIYAPVSITPQLVFLPTKRGLKQVNEGILDAEAGRVDKAVTQYENLLKIPTPITKMRLSIYCLNKQDCKTNSQAGILVIQGGIMAARLCNKLNLNCNRVMNDVSAFKALQKGHAPALITNDRFALGTLCKSGLSQIYTKPLTQIYSIYHYVNKKHAELIPKLTQSIDYLIESKVLPGTFRSLSDAARHCNIKVITLTNQALEG
ncbi:hypothetical protein PSECIP111951_03387 [Pseudoalteromonas holothuriae]|uniref:Solute-binding protein family 3/N-terminal domain-containing protein n=1 Tax=Pseudoalteromonas holothuriae TaxID=2963714 RepID=A0ABM9GNJ8_9GAMM|nr:hypothetical protein [Pseudoalteromonas sp. CIP111951]CAH9065548.1 hypothetical protein PSECIP111951_03387 [Pseudoalteromonas sp. CIP111951]